MKQEERTARTKKAIEDAFWELYVKDPRGVTAKDVSERAGINRSTLYLYYGNTSEILESIERGLLERWTACLCDETMTSIDDVIAGLKRFVEENGARVLFLIGPNGDPGFAVTVKEGLSGIFGRRLGAPADDEDFRLTVEFLVTGLLAAVKLSFEEHGAIDVDRLAGLMRRWMTEGIYSTIPGDPEKIDEFQRMVRVNPR